MKSPSRYPSVGDLNFLSGELAILASSQLTWSIRRSVSSILFYFIYVCCLSTELIELVVISMLIFIVCHLMLILVLPLIKVQGRVEISQNMFNPAALLCVCPKSGTFVNGCLRLLCVHPFSMFYIVLWSDSVRVFAHIFQFRGHIKLV